MRKQMSMNIMRPQEGAPDALPQNWAGTMSQGIPVRQIPHLEFPRTVYKHPNRPTKTIEHRNDKFEVVGTEVVPTEHLTKSVGSAEELEESLADGWVKEPYIPKAPPNPDEKLYDRPTERKKA
jgi:hypothetical protein